MSKCWLFVNLSTFPTASEFLSIQPEFHEYESAGLDEVREFRAVINSFPDAHVTWLKDGSPLSDVTAEISISLQKISETRWASVSDSTADHNLRAMFSRGVWTSN